MIDRYDSFRVTPNVPHQPQRVSPTHPKKKKKKQEEYTYFSRFDMFMPEVRNFKEMPRKFVAKCIPLFRK